MALELKSNSEYKGDPSQLPGANAPMPDNASLYLDFKNGLYLARDITTGKLFRSTLISEITSLLALRKRPSSVLTVFSRP
ncbi:Uncharacterised protein [Klebsiella pneumoniae]|nr:Uncharacterised protein [Klebsiella pneumoniae]